MHTKDLTHGSPVKLILAFALPLLIGNLFQQVYNMVDTMVCGYTLGDGAIASIGAVSALWSLIINFAQGMNNGYALVSSRYFGAQDIRSLKRSIGHMIKLNVIVATVLTAASVMFMKPLLEMMNVRGAIYHDAYVYITIICAGMASTVAYNMFSCILRAVGNSRTPLYYLIFSSVLNVMTDVLFVKFIGMGIAGAAVATVLSQTVSAALCGIHLFRKYKDILPSGEDMRLEKKMLCEMLVNGMAMAFMISVVDMGSVIFQRANNALGEIYISAYTAARRIIVIFMSPLSSISTAAATFIGQNRGAKKFARMDAGIKQVMAMEMIWGVFSCAVVYLFGGALIRFTTGTDSEFIVRNGVLSLRLHFPFYPALGLLICMRNAMQALDHKIAPLVSSSIELGMKIFSAAFLIPHFGFLGTCVTEPVTWVLCMVFLCSMYFGRRKQMLLGHHGQQLYNMTSHKARA